MNVYDLLRDTNCRISLGSRWLVFDGDTWTVLEKKPYQKKTRLIIETESEQEAVESMWEEHDS